MTETKVARRYAKSLLDLAIEKGVADAVVNDMRLVASVCEANRLFALLLDNPTVHADKKLAVLKAIFSGKVNAMTISFFEIIARKRREADLHAIAVEYIEAFKKNKGIETAVIISAVGLDDTLRAKVRALFKNNSGSEVELIEKTDKNLIGGFVLRIGDKQFDASIQKNLKKIATEFSENPYIKKN